jgi:hypothetical protein
MKNHGWTSRAVTQDRGASLERSGTLRSNPLIRRTRGGLILALALGAIGAADAAAISAHASSEPPGISLATTQQTAPGNDISNHWMY